VLVSDGDALELFRQAQQDGRVTAQTVEAVFKRSEDLVQPRNPGWIPGAAHSLTLGNAVSSHAGGSNSAAAWQEVAVRKIRDKLTASVLGNPHRLKRAFRKYDVDGNGLVLAYISMSVSVCVCDSNLFMRKCRRYIPHRPATVCTRND
jgi:hypothetical protein